jgi:DNA polymerase III subunit alpha
VLDSKRRTVYLDCAAFCIGANMTNKIKFVNLHGHSTFSIFDGLGYPQEHMDFAYENGCDALALTDHGNMNGLSYQILHAKKMKEEGKTFKPIFGVEAYFNPSIEEWKINYEKSKEDKKVKKDSATEVSLVIEDEEESKKLEKDSLNFRAHLILLAQNKKGLSNIFKLVSKSYEAGRFYRFPRIDYELLEEHSEGVIVMTACMGGVLSKCYWSHIGEGEDRVLEEMRKTVKRFKTIFGDRFFCELQWNAYKEQHEINKLVIKVAQENDIKLVSTCDSHYPRPELWKAREVYKMLGWLGSKGASLDSLPKDRESLMCELYPKNGQQMWESFQKYACGHQYDESLVLESFENSWDIAHNLIEDFLPETKVRLPSFVVPPGKTDMQALVEACSLEMRRRLLHKDKQYIERLKEELLVIKDRGFAKYFLTMKAIADKAVETQLVGAGRGSAAGSLISYLINITQIDPIKYGLLFSRFLQKNAKDYPDIDFDTSDPMVLKQVLIEKWGDDCVVPITNWNTLQLRSLIKDISKLYSIPFQEVNSVTSVMVKEATSHAKEKHGITAGMYVPTFEECLEYSESLRDFLVKYPEIKTHVKALQGQVRSASRHAGGVIVSENISEYMPLINSGGVRQTPWTEGQNVRHLEPLGFIKFDILGLATLRMIENAIKRILINTGISDPSFENVKEFYDRKLHPEAINFEDQKIYKEVFHEGKWISIFQFTEGGAQEFCSKAKPKNIIDLSAITSIYRPGPLSANVDHNYVQAKEDPESIKYLHPIVKEVTQETFGFLIFQEQIALIAHKLGKGVTLDEGNLLRKILTKKGTGKGNEVKDEIYKKFIEGCIEKEIDKEDAEKLWQTFEFFSGYGFNKSHAVCYSILSYQCAWLLTYYPEQWIAAYLDEETQNDSGKFKAISTVKSLGYKVEPPNINTSGRDWEVSKDGLTFFQPLNSIKGLGEKAIEQAINNRPYKSIEDLLFNDNIVYSKLNKKGFDALARSGTLDSLIDERFVSKKHFCKSFCVDRPRTKKKFDLYIEEYKGEEEYTKEEQIDNYTKLLGTFPIEMVMSRELYNKLGNNKVSAISSYDKDLGICWFIPSSIETKVSRNNKHYYVVQVTDDSGKSTEIRVWSVNPEKDFIYMYRPYVAKINYDEDYNSFSCIGISGKWKMIG